MTGSTLSSSSSSSSSGVRSTSSSPPPSGGVSSSSSSSGNSGENENEAVTRFAITADGGAVVAVAEYAGTGGGSGGRSGDRQRRADAAGEGRGVGAPDMHDELGYEYEYEYEYDAWEDGYGGAGGARLCVAPMEPLRRPWEMLGQSVGPDRQVVDEAFAAEEACVRSLTASDGELGELFNVRLMGAAETFEDYMTFLEWERMEAARQGPALSPEEAAAAALARRQQLAVRKFNDKASEGVRFLIAEGLIEDTAASLVAWLRSEPEGIYKSRIGELLGDPPSAFSKALLSGFVSTFDFQQMRLDEALRAFLATFRLPGEAQKIDRIMECFAGQYHRHNPHVWQSPDTAYVLSFALIMLNTDAHNPGVRDKMTLEQFGAVCRGIDSGKDLDAELLGALYASITENEIILEPDGPASALDNPDHSGYLRKQGGKVKTWKRRWFLLSGNCLYYFKDEDHAIQNARATAGSIPTRVAPPKGIVPLEGIKVVDPDPDDLRFVIKPRIQGELMKAAKASGGQMVHTNHHEFQFKASDIITKREWIEALHAHTHQDPFYALMDQKRISLEAEVALAGGNTQQVLARRHSQTRRTIHTVERIRARTGSTTAATNAATNGSQRQRARTTRQ